MSIELKAGDTLPNGATVLALGPIDVSPGKLDAQPVLALSGKVSTMHPYAIWCMTLDGVTTHGDYHRTLDTALVAFRERQV